MRGLICLWAVALAPILWATEDPQPAKQPAARDQPAGEAPAEAKKPTDETPQGTEQPATFDFAAFGRLPVWYNGRVTDWSRVAENLVLHLSGTTEMPRLDGEKSVEKGDGNRDGTAEAAPPETTKANPPVRWLLDVLSGGEAWRSQPLILVDQDHLRPLVQLNEETKLPARLPVKSFENTGGLEAEYNRIQNATVPWTKEDRQVLDLVDRLKTLQTMLEVLRLPDTSARETALVALQRDTELRKQAIPFLVPPRRAGEGWTSLTMALVLREFGAQAGAEANPAADKLLPILTSYGANDPAAFNRAVADYAGYLADLKLDPSPWTMNVPDGWTEIGVPPSQEPGYFSDTRRVGATVALLSRRQGTGQATLRINVFPSPVAAREKMINSWRLSVALPPKSAGDLPLEKIDVAGTPGWRVDFETPEGLPVKPTRMLGAVFPSGPGPGPNNEAGSVPLTWVVTCEGSPDLVARSVETFDVFLKSIQVGPASRMAESLGLVPEPPNPELFGPGIGYVAAFIPVGESMWVLRGPMIPELDHETKRQEFRRLLRSLQPREPTADNGLPFEWADPPSWTLHSSPEGGRSIRAGSDEFLLSAEAFAAGEGSIGDMIHTWRSEFLLSDWSREDLANATQSFEWKGGTATLVSWSLPMVAADPVPNQLPQGAPLTDDEGVGIAFGQAPPENWEPVRNAFAQAAFQIKDADGAAQVTVVALPGDGGGLEKNTARWRSQLAPSDKEAESIKIESTKVKVQGAEADRIELGSEGTKRTIAIAIPHGGRTWFVKLTGDSGTVERVKKDFDTFATGIELRGGKPPEK